MERQRDMAYRIFHAASRGCGMIFYFYYIESDAERKRSYDTV